MAAIRIGVDVGALENTMTGHTYRLISNNTIESNDQGIVLGLSATLSNNSIQNSSAAAVWQSASTATSALLGNEIRNTPLGFSPFHSCAGIPVYPIVEFNNFVNTTDWAILQGGCTAIVPAANNYWGHPDGPTYNRGDNALDPILDPIVPEEIGYGGRVTFGVVFAPWLTEPNPHAGPVPEN
ncbi:MAG: hypothetical protein HY556_10750 [Euryarchaeota archaeon]|nr:hypothetical protein [Euryarchaeota archaeon]